MPYLCWWGVEVVYDFAHLVEVVRIDGEDAALTHIVWKAVVRLVLQVISEGIGVPMSVHVVSGGIPAAAYLDIPFTTSTKSV